MTTEELEALARQWAAGQVARWVYPANSKEEQDRKKRIAEARNKILDLGYDITTNDWGYVVIEMPFKA